MQLIDPKKTIEALTHWETEPTDEEIIYTINNLPTIEAIPKADYENRTTTDMATIKQLSNSIKALQKANSEIAGAYDKFKADYENRLKADMVVMLEELDNKIMEEYIEHMEVDWHTIIQQKINSLKENVDGENNIHR